MPRGLAGAAVAVVLAALTLGPLAVVALAARAPSSFGAADWSALRFTVAQALVSATISCLLAIPVARALARRRFPGRSLLITLLGAPFILPVIIAVLGLIAVFGRAGVVNTALGAMGLPPLAIYGFHGVVLAHVFFNLPLATRLLLQAWVAVPAEQFRLAASLGFTARDTARVIERPLLRATLPGAFATIFLLCLTSFAVALTLGGGPKATTVELAIYQAVRFDFDLTRAAQLAAIQFTLCAVAAIAATHLTPASTGAPGLDRPVGRWDAAHLLLKLQDGAVLAGAAAFLIVPMATLALDALPGLGGLPAQVWPAAARSLAVAVCSAALATGGALALAAASPRWQTAAYLPLAASPMVMGVGLFLLVFPVAEPSSLALPLTALVNAVLALPFALRALAPAYAETEATWGRLADQLGLTGTARLRLVILPRLRRPLGFCLGLAAALSMGDLGVIALFAGTGGETLPLQIYRLMGAYRMADAGAAALLLLILSLGLFRAFDQWGRTHADP